MDCVSAGVHEVMYVRVCAFSMPDGVDVNKALAGTARHLGWGASESLCLPCECGSLCGHVCEGVLYLTCEYGSQCEQEPM